MEDDPQKPGEANPEVQLPWVRANPSDLIDFDFEAPIAKSDAGDSWQLSELYRHAANPQENGQVADTQAGRVFSMLWSVTAMHFKPNEANEPFGAMMVHSDGRRSALPDDFRGEAVEVLAQMAERSNHPVLRARLADVSWLLDKKRSKLAGLAAEAYVEVVQQVDVDKLKFRFDEDFGTLKYDARDLLRRALQIGRAIGMDKPGPAAARGMVATLRARAIKECLPIPTGWFSHLDLDYGISGPDIVGGEVEALIPTLPADTDPHVILGLWRLVARAYHFAKNDEKKSRARSAGAEELVSMGKQQLSAILGAQFLSEAIAELHGVPGMKERRRELNHILIDVQARISDEMSSFSMPFDVKDIAERTEQAFRLPSARDQLFAFAALARSPEPSDLVDQAKKSISQYPLSSLFGASHHDSEGKVIHRSEGAGFGENQDTSAVARQIAQDEQWRRQFIAAGQIEPARQAIVATRYITDDLFTHLLAHSPFVPHDLLLTFCRGFVRFFQGDFTSGLYILTPLLENSLRHVLKSHGYEVSKFDDATLTQQDRAISALFEQMREELDGIFGKALTTDIENVFLKKPRPYLRHSLAHGLLHDSDPYGPDAIYACWLIFRLCMLPLFPHSNAIKLPFDDPDSAQA